jgi:2-polyprenyl-3-methyl-5-hydroxy-6-metoxy-1,4-benzoquinol methylase
MLSIVKKAYRILKGKSYVLSLKEKLVGYKTVLDIGCGVNSPLGSFSESFYSVGIDIFKPAILRSKKRGTHGDYVLAEIHHLCFKPESFEAVLALDVLEHLKKTDGYRFMENMAKIARCALVVFTPNGFVHQLELEGNLYQVHLSGWTVAKLRKFGFQVNGINGLKILRKEKAELRFKPERLFGRFSDISQKLAYHFPNLAFQLLCVKKLHNK